MRTDESDEDREETGENKYRGSGGYPFSTRV
jgi:hypothetical protein